MTRAAAGVDGAVVTPVEGRSIAREKLEHGALDRARHMLRMGFFVYEIRQPSGTLYLDGDALRQRLGEPAAAS